MRFRFKVLLMILLLATIPSSTSAISTDDSHGEPPAPVFETLNNTGQPAGSHIYADNTGLLITYSADRFDVEGLVLVGSGSGLTNDPSTSIKFTKVSSQRATSFYEVELNLTEYTYFKAYAWYGSVDNGTYEVLDVIDDSPGHELWVSNGALYPTFDEGRSSMETQNGDLYSSLNQNVTISYRVRNSVDDPNEEATLAIAENRSVIYDQDEAQWVKMDKVNYTTIGNFEFSIFEFTFNFTVDNYPSIIYFTAVNDYGWERSSADTPVIHKLNPGFNISQTFDQRLDLYTTLDPIKVNITTFNETSEMNVGYEYRYFANASTNVPAINWSSATPSLISSEELNSTLNDDTQVNSTLKQVYEGEITNSFDAGNVVEVRSFATYGEGSRVTTSTTSIEIIDPSPNLTVLSRNKTITRAANKTIQFGLSTPKGDIDRAVLIHTLPNNVTKSPVNIISQTNSTVEFSEADNSTVLEGNHIIKLNLTNSLGLSTVRYIVFTVDRSEPEGSISIVEPASGATTTGKVTVSFEFEDLGVEPSGVKYATLDWGVNMTINATNLSQASFTYRRSGDYTITLNVWDVAGNNASTQIDVIVSLDNTGTTTTNNRSPVPLVPILGGLSIITTISVLRRRKSQV